MQKYKIWEFQCSSASRKFLNIEPRIFETEDNKFQCSSASRKFLNRGRFQEAHLQVRVSVLFSEPKISQSDAQITHVDITSVSVLFSEPKISQS